MTDVRFSTIIVNAENTRGISVTSSADTLKKSSGKLSISLSDSTIEQGVEGIAYPFVIYRAGLADINMDNVSISIKKNYYSFYLYDVGSNEGPVSTVLIKDSYIKGWAAFYVQANTQNLEAEVVGSTLVGIGQNSGVSDNFATIAIDSSSNVKLSVVGSEIVFDKVAEAEQRAAAIYYFDNKDPYTGGNRISFENCDFKLEGKNATSSGVMAYADNITGKSTEPLETGNEEFVYEEKTTVERNEIIFDAASLDSLTSQGYVHENITEEIEKWLHIPASENQQRPKDGYAYRFDEDIYMFAYADGAEKGFAGGAGTQGHPYLIENVEQFMNIASLQDDMLTSDGKGAYLYFSITEDLDFSYTENLGIQLVRGELDFNNHWVTGVHSDNLASGHYSLIFDVIEGKIKNLNYEPDTAVQFVYTSGYLDAVSVMDERVISFENVNVSGTFENVANNGSLYISQAFDGSLEFHNCVNSSVMTGNQYNGVFLGGYPNSRTERLVFDNCRFTGSLIVKNAGFLVGNSAGFASEVVVKDCVNDGLVAGTESVGYYCGLKPDMPEVKVLNEDVQKYISGSGHVRVLDSGLSASYNNDKTVVTISCNDPGSVSYKVAATGYSKMRTPDYKDYGTLLVSFEAEGEFGEPDETVNISFPVQKVVDYIYAERNGGVESQDSFGNDIVTIGGKTYYLVVEKHPLAEDYSVTSMIIDNQNEHIAADLNYSVYSYDAEGVPTGYLKLEI